MIVVGVDGTAASRAALAFALREGARRGCVIEVVTAWHAYAEMAGQALAGLLEGSREAAQAVQDAALADVMRKVQLLPVLSRRVVRGDPAEELLRAASLADYLVVGGVRREVSQRSLGSVSERCVRRASCPVVVVPGFVSWAAARHAD